jgi:hypothetical protein
MRPLIPGGRKLDIIHNSRVSNPTARLITGKEFEVMSAAFASVYVADSGTCRPFRRLSELYKSMYGMAVACRRAFKRSAVRFWDID